MTTALRPHWPSAADRALDLAEALRAEIETTGLPPAVLGLPPRPRAAYDRLLDAINRLPRPLMVLGSLALLGSALVAPEWFQARMDALSDMPDALWWIVGGVLSLHFGARFQDRSLDLRREEVLLSRAPPPDPVLPEATASPGHDAELVIATLASGPNPALEDWRASRA
jgi:hypothetical protein